ncbi:hypothetical protein F4802DRAFT_566185 [Xylaria palmicola]|nr:hypothetical protein F4802DRAFT_566185 [Xylaria palmicola]
MISTRKTLGFDPSMSDTPFDDLITLDFMTLNINGACNATTRETETCAKHPWAVRCSLYPCIKTFDANIVNSILSENLTSSIPMKKSNISAVEVTTSKNLTWSYAVNTTLRHGQRVDCNPSSIPTINNTVAITINMTSPISGEEAVTWYPEDCVYLLGYPAALYGGGYWLKTFYNNGMVNLSSASAYFGSLAGEMTASMRQNGQSAALAEVVGSVLESHTCIRIQWPWLTLPVFFVMATTGYLVSTIVLSTWRGPWKTSFLAAVFFGAHDAALEQIKLESSRSGMIETAKNVQVQLHVDE